MENNMTILSTEMFEKATKNNFTVEHAVEMLMACTSFRTLSQKLNAFSNGKDIKKLLINGLCEHHPEKNPETISRNVRNWLSDRQNKIQKKDAIEICFILDLDFEASNTLVAMISEEALHWRNPDEIPYIFALYNKLSFNTAVELDKKIKQQLSVHISANREKSFTNVVKKEIIKIKSENELVDYVVENYARLNSYHNTAFELFCEMMKTLEFPLENDNIDDGYLAENKKYSVGKIVQAYMHREDIPELDTKDHFPKSETAKTRRKDAKTAYSAIQRSVAQNWPSETMISRIFNRNADVTRKILILLFLATFDVGSTAENDDLLEWDAEYEKSGDEIFEEFYMGMNQMLENCGFVGLDPRSPFDWIVIFCMCIDDIYEIDGVFTDFLRILYPKNENGNESQE